MRVRSRHTIIVSRSQPIVPPPKTKLQRDEEMTTIKVCAVGFGSQQLAELTRPADTRPSTDRLTGLLQNPDSLSYNWLIGSWRRSLRNRRWAMLHIAEKGLFRCALWVAKARGKISNKRLMAQVLRIVLKLLHAPKSRIAEAGTRRAMVMSGAYSKSDGVFSWAPRMR